MHKKLPAGSGCRSSGYTGLRIQGTHVVISQGAGDAALVVGLSNDTTCCDDPAVAVFTTQHTYFPPLLLFCPSATWAVPSYTASCLLALKEKTREKMKRWTKRNGGLGHVIRLMDCMTNDVEGRKELLKLDA